MIQLKEELEKSGHKIVIVKLPASYGSTYWCSNCRLAFNINKQRDVRYQSKMEFTLPKEVSSKLYKSGYTVMPVDKFEKCSEIIIKQVIE